MTSALEHELSRLDTEIHDQKLKVFEMKSEGELNPPDPETLTTRKQQESEIRQTVKNLEQQKHPLQRLIREISTVPDCEP